MTELSSLDKIREIDRESTQIKDRLDKLIERAKDLQQERAELVSSAKEEIARRKQQLQEEEEFLKEIGM